MATKQQRSFNVQEYADKVMATLARLEKEQKPGQQTGTGSKMDVLHAVKGEIVDLIKKGYTAKQIADALKDDVFAILPKTITELTGAKSARKQRTKQATDKQQADKPDTNRKPVSGAPAAGSKATFAIKPDTEDL